MNNNPMDGLDIWLLSASGPKLPFETNLANVCFDVSLYFRPAFQTMRRAAASVALFIVLRIGLF